MTGVQKLLLCYLALLCFLKCCAAVDFISANQTIRDGETIVSAGESFEMGFFSPGNSRYRYFGIWYKRQATGTVVWVANREAPLTNTSGVLRLDPEGILEIRNASDRVIWWSTSSGSVSDPVAQLLDTGNLVIKDQRDSSLLNPLWQSFDFPGDNNLAEMKFGKDLVTGRDWSCTSWKSADDPSPGNFTILIDTSGYPQNYVKEGSDIVFRAGPWNGIRFAGEPNLRPNPIYTFGFVLNQEEVYYHYELINSSVITRVLVTPNGEVQRLLWIDSSQVWTVYLTTRTDNCDRYKLCGANGNCNINNSPACACLEGFVPNFPEQWNVGDWSHGCRRRTPLDCGSDEGFIKYSEKKLPDTRDSWYNLSVNLDECQQLCKSNCTCTAYANANISGSGSGCILWFGDLLDTRDFSNTGQDIYVRMAASELPPATTGGKDSKTLKQVKIIIPVISALLILLGLLLLCLFKRRKLKRQGYTNEAQKEDLELPLFGLSTLLAATNSFSIQNKLGEGGFGPVYKGVLKDGQDIAVKRLSKTSCQGLEEFMNEVICISKLQHRNLVKLLGCCIQGEEKMLVYEYMANKSLDSYIFGETNSKLLSWPQRWHIINGIARGLLYLHHDSRLRIIHRDLKASNILLDSDMNPKISDFGIARSFCGNETEANTNRVIGTYGYMSPEYAGDGIFSFKSDVFSFGVLVLEILSGKRNRGFSHQEHNYNLLGHVWILFQEGRSVELVDAPMDDSVNLSEVLRSIHVGLLCVQQNPEDRPVMSSVVLMLGNEGALPPPKHPGFFTGTTTGDSECSSSMLTSTANELTITMGVLEDGQEIAVKRLSKTSCQGLEEFKNEVICISKLQHRNLVKLLGCFIQGEVMMLVYEYMANKSLDSYIFDKNHSKLLAWPQQGHIINGIARGLLYLHQDSRLRIIHRDLKASNILLESDMIPKISDFGIARSFGGNETEANTNRVMGTFGYMSPEYAGDGIFSVKSDVVSFGVLVLEILSGKRNRGFSHQDHNHNLLGYAWILYQEGRSVELVDAPMDDSINLSEVFRAIHVGLLCVQHNPEDRPVMSSVVLMLGNEGALPPPKHPGFFTGTTTGDFGCYSSMLTRSTANELTVTMVNGR